MHAALETAPVLGWDEPGGQFRHVPVDAPPSVVEYLPEEQETHMPTRVAPSVLE